MSGLMYGGGASGSGSGMDREKPELGMDAAAENSFCDAFQRLPEKPEGTARLFDRGDFYSAHGADAQLVASTVFKTHSVIKNLGRSSLASVTLSVANAKNFLREALTVKQMRVEIWAGGTKRSNNWTLSKQASPGNLQEVEDLLFMTADIVTSPIVMALKIGTQDGVKTVGAAFADATNQDLGVAEFADSELFNNVESLVIQLGVKECLLPADEKNLDFDLSRLRGVLDRCGCVITTRKRADFTARSIEQDMARLLKEDTAVAAVPEFNLKVAMGAASALLAYLGLLTIEANFGQFTLRTHDLSQFLRLDSSALRALSIFPEPGQPSGGQNMSVYSLLNKCKTAQGQRMLSQWLKQPLVNVLEIRKRHDLVGIFCDDTNARQAIQADYLKLMPDLHRLSKRFQKGVATLEDVVRIYQAALRLPGLLEVLDNVVCEGGAAQKLLEEAFIKDLKVHESNLSKLIEMVEATLDLEELDHHNYVIKPDFDDRLREIKDGLDVVRDGLDEEHRKAGKDLGLDIEKKLHMENHSVYGYCFRVTRADAKVLSTKKSYREVGTAKNGVHFVSPRLKELREEFKDLSEQYSSQQSGLVKDVISIAASYCPPLEQLNVTLAKLDVIVSFAHVSVNAPVPYVRPTLHEKGSGAPLRLREARHPCLEVQEDINFISNDVTMEDDSQFLVITGPNMGGKSTFIRQLGIISLLAQAGCFIPADEGSELPVFDCILARVGAGDSQLKGVSTFMAEMLETATILKTATSDSLIIIDELGRGTSTYDGFGLAWAISEWICTRIKCKTLFASHFAEITTLADQQPHVSNLHVVAHVSERKSGGSKQDRDITLLYKVEPGVCDRSYGIHVAELANFPESVINLAKRKAEELEDREDESESPLDLPEDVTEQGAELVEEFMAEWGRRSAALASKAEAAAAADDDGQAPTKKRKLGPSPSAQLEELKRVVDDFMPRLEANAWAKAVIESF